MTLVPDRFLDPPNPLEKGEPELREIINIKSNISKIILSPPYQGGFRGILLSTKVLRRRIVNHKGRRGLFRIELFTFIHRQPNPIVQYSHSTETG